MRRIYEAAVIFVGTLGWWGFIYPELSMVTESCAQEAEAEVQEIETEIQGEETGAPAETPFWPGKVHSVVKIGEKLGSTGIMSGNLCIKSRIAEYLYQGREKDKTEKESGYE